LLFFRHSSVGSSA